MAMNYLPLTDLDRKEMLNTIGVDSIEELLQDIPGSVYIKDKLNLPNPLSEPELIGYFSKLARKNINLSSVISFLGGGVYNHFIPAAVREILKRTEFYTVYTPYQPEISQGLLQAIFEYQTMICNLTGMDVSNASHYDGATSLAEAVGMACRFTKRDKVLISGGVHPDYLKVVKTYFSPANITLEIEELNNQFNTLIPDKDPTSYAALVVQNPNFFGAIEEVEPLSQWIHKGKGLLIVVISEPISLGLLKVPGDCGADIVAGEGQAFGNAPSFGGPHFGFLACKREYLRQLPGRIVGETVDIEGKEAFVLTLQAREQHIRREKALSNICSNHALGALAGAIYLSLLGGKGLREVAIQCFQKAHYARDRLKTLKGFSLPQLVFFNEFPVYCPVSGELIVEELLGEGIIAGLPVKKLLHSPKWESCLLLAFTELHKKEDIDKLILALKRWS